MQVHRRNWAEGLVLRKDRRPAKKVDFDKTFALLPLKMLMLLSKKDFIPLPHQNLPELPELLVSKVNFSGTSLAAVSRSKVCFVSNFATYVM